MNILIYNLTHIILFPFFLIFLILRLFNKKENLESFFQKLFCKGDKNYYGYIIHVASVGELNSINYLIQKIPQEKRILITCSTLSAHKLASKKYKQCSVKYLPYDFYPLVRVFLAKNMTDKFIWIDSEIWPNYLRILKSKKIPTYLINGRISEKSFRRWKMVTKFVKELGSIYKIIYASSLPAKESFEILFQRKIFYSGNLKYYQDLNIVKNIENNLCFASIHLKEFKDILKIIEKIDFNIVEKIFLIPRHPHYAYELNRKLLESNIPKDKVVVFDSMGKNKNIHSISKLSFIGGSLFNHGGQNPLEALSCGSYVLTGPYTHNFSSIYEDLEEKKLCGVFKEIDHTLIAKSISVMMSKKNLLDINEVRILFKKQSEDLNIITNSIIND